jgi:hypothetical protein
MKTLFFILSTLCSVSFGLWFVSAIGHDMGLISRVWHDTFLTATIGTGLMGFIVAQVLIFDGSK